MSSQIIDPGQESPPNSNVNEPQPRRQHPLANYQFSPDELRVLRECNTESFFQRSIPLSTIFGFSTYYGVRQGYLTPNSKYGAVPKVVVSVIIGYFLGKFSYQRKCAEKMMQLPNSKLGQLLRQRKQGTFYDSLPQQGLTPSFGLPSFGSSTPDVYTDENMRSKSSSFDLDTERPPQKELDDIYKPSLDGSPIIADDNQSSDPPKPSISYDDLRKQNRENYLKSRSDYGRLSPPQNPIQSTPTPVKPEEPQAQKNKYGDVWS